MEKQSYIGSLGKAVASLATGLKTTMREYFTPKITEQYPENRKTLKMFDRFRGTLVMPHNEQNEHKCVACGLCQMACPNDSIHVVSETITTEEGKKKKLPEKAAVKRQGITACLQGLQCRGWRQTARRPPAKRSR